MRSPVRYALLALALCVGCDDPSQVGNANAENRIPTGYYSYDGGFVADTSEGGSSPNLPGGDAGTASGAGDAGAAGDSGAPPDPDAGTLAPTGDCAIGECGPMPSTTPLCFDGDAAGVECSPYFGTCTWQFVCGP